MIIACIHIDFKKCCDFRHYPMYVPIVCVYFCAKEKLKEIVPQKRFSVIYLVNDCGH
jgi:hypothetical protein